MAKLLKGTDWLDPEDPIVIAENELLGATAKKLRLARDPKKHPGGQRRHELRRDDLESGKIQRCRNIDPDQSSERVAERADSNRKWSESLISAIRMVAAATYSWSKLSVLRKN